MTLTKRGKDWNEGYKQGALEELKMFYSECYALAEKTTDGRIYIGEIRFFKKKRIKELEKGKVGGLK